MILGYSIDHQRGSQIRIGNPPTLTGETTPNHSPIKIGTLAHILQNIAKHQCHEAMKVPRGTSIETCHRKIAARSYSSTLVTAAETAVVPSDRRRDSHRDIAA